eukprot:scaffold7379_cov126-Isochrysis_galbana.AAC.4
MCALRLLAGSARLPSTRSLSPAACWLAALHVARVPCSGHSVGSFPILVSWTACWCVRVTRAMCVRLGCLVRCGLAKIRLSFALSTTWLSFRRPISPQLSRPLFRM